jgi:hypothetical protein
MSVKYLNIQLISYSVARLEKKQEIILAKAVSERIMGI